MKKRIIIILVLFAAILGSVAFLKSFDGGGSISTPQFYVRDHLKQKVQEIADRYSDGDVIVVSKKDHLLYYCRKGFIVRGDRWGGFVYDFPVPVALGRNNNWTPEGKFKIERKNDRSRFTLFLGFKGLYGIHGTYTHLASKLDLLESVNPDLQYVTRRDHTLGCVAVETRVIRYLFAKVDIDTPVYIMP